jgi:hypothetical protein
MTNSKEQQMNEDSNGTVYLKWTRVRGGIAQLIRQKFKGQDLLHLRAYYLDKSGEFQPTREGVTIPREQISPLCEALREAEKALTPAKPTKSKKKWGR